MRQIDALEEIGVFATGRARTDFILHDSHFGTSVPFTKLEWVGRFENDKIAYKLNVYTVNNDGSRSFISADEFMEMTK